MRILLIIICLFCCLYMWPQEEGFASWYGGKFNGRLTASGEVYDMEQLTAAHKTLAFNTVVRVINLKNEKDVVVRINDRGPFVEGRIIDLSRAAAEVIDLVGLGIAYVRLEILENPDQELYCIQVGAFNNQRNAAILRNQLEQAGLEVIFETSATGLIRVLIVNIEADALAATEKVLERLQISGYFRKKQRTSI